jgi:hypothetical protein
VFGRPIVGSINAIKSREEIAQRINWSPVGIPDVFQGLPRALLNLAKRALP